MFSANRDRKPAEAFTLLELLVVVSVISALISILIPNPSAAQRHAGCHEKGQARAAAWLPPVLHAG